MRVITSRYEDEGLFEMDAWLRQQSSMKDDMLFSLDLMECSLLFM